MNKRIAVIFFMFCSLVAPGQTKKVLFIGNSYTFYNDMPQIVANMASAAGCTLTWKASTIAGYTLQQHSANSATIGLIQEGGWDYVVLQEFSQYPSEPLSTVDLYVYPYARYLHTTVNSYNAHARTMFYMTWGRKNGDADRCSRLPEVCTYMGMDNLTRERYMYMALDNQAEVSPVGAVWRYIRENYPSIELYSSDGSHPSEAGSYAAACAFYASIFRKNPALLSYNYSLSSIVAANIRNAAMTVVFNNLSSWYIGAYDVPDNQAPSVPSALNATDGNPNGLTLKWTSSTDNVGIAGYYVYQNGSQIGNVSTPGMVISGLAPASTYTFTVRARDGAGNLSSPSAPFSFTTTDNDPPTAPMGFTVSNFTATGFTLGWLASTDNLAVTGYDVYRDGVPVASVTGTSASFAGLNLLVPYAMTVRAKDAFGNTSPLSKVFQVTIPDQAAPAVPAGLVASDITQNSFTLGWTASSDNVAVMSYEVYRNGTLYQTVSGTRLSVGGLTPSTAYAMTVKAKDAAKNTSANSVVLNVTTLANVLPDTQSPSTPSNLMASSVTQTSLVLSWNASSDNVGVKNYLVFKNGIQELVVTGTTACITGLSASINYTFTVRAKDAANNVSEISNSIIVTPPDTESPSAPEGLAATQTGNAAMNLHWNASSDNVGVVIYEVLVNGGNKKDVTGVVTDIKGLAPSTTYAITVRARDGAGNISSPGSMIYYTAPDYLLQDTLAPTIPTGLIAAGSTETTLTLRWLPSADSNRVAGYDISVNELIYHTGPETLYVIDGLTASTNYLVKVRARDAADNASAYSLPLPASTLAPSTPDASKPSRPASLAADSITHAGCRLTWNPSSDNVGVSGYTVIANHEIKAIVVQNIVHLTNLMPGENYDLSVVAKDVSGNVSDTSNRVFVTTGNGHIPDTRPPSCPSMVTASSIMETGCQLTWVPSYDSIGVTGYDIYRNGLLIQTSLSNTAQITGLAPGSSYGFSVKARDAAGNRSAASSGLMVNTPDLHAPSIPAGLSSNDVTETSCTLSWGTSSDNVAVVAYQLFKDGALLGTYTSNIKALTGLTAGNLYTIALRAVDAAGNMSALSAPLNVTTADLYPPGTPSGLNVTGLYQTGFTLNWTAAADNVGVTGYQVFRNGNLIRTATGTSVTLDGLLPSATHTMTLRATDAAGNLSAPVSLVVITPDTQAPSVPFGLLASQITQNTLTLSWISSTDNVGVVAYEIYRDGTLIANVAANSHGVSGLPAYTTSSFTVKARDAADNVSASSLALIVRTLDGQPPTAPSVLTYSNLTQSGFRLTWQTSTDNAGVTGYFVYQDGSQIASVTNTSINVTGLRASHTYYITVRATDAAGNLSAISNPLAVTTPDTEAPTAPDHLTFNDLSQTGFTLTWNASVDNVGVTGYEVYRDGVLVASMGGTAAGIVGLSPFRYYNMTVKAKDAAGNVSASSAVLRVRTPDTEVPSTPQNLACSNLTQSGFTLTWTASTDNVGVVQYEIYDNNTLLKTVTGSSTQLSNLAAARTYDITVRAVDEAGNRSFPSASLTVTTPDTEAPSAPAGLNFVNLTQWGFTLRWLPSTDNVGVTAYQIFKDEVLLGSSTTNSMVISGLEACVTYSLKVKARDAAGNISATSLALLVTTPDMEAPSVPAEVTYSHLTETGFRLQWMASVDNIGVSGYKVYGNNKLILQTSDTHVELEGLKVFSPYAMDIRAMDEAGNVSEKSEIVNVRTLDLHAPLAPENLKTFEVTDSSLLLSWSPSLDNVGILSYDVFLNGSFLSTHPDTSILIQQLGASRTYSFKVVARDSAENLSSASLPVQVITPDTRAPQKPGGLEAYGTGFRSFVLKWPHSADNVGVTQYRVFQDDVQIAALKENFLFVEGLTVNTTYKMSVAACDAAGNISDTSDCLEVTTVYPGEENAVTAFPNPVSDHILYMDLGTDTFNQGIIEWFNDQGHRIFKMIATPNNRMPSLDLSEYQLYNGMYVLRVKIDGRIFEQKILINRP